MGSWFGAASAPTASTAVEAASSGMSWDKLLGAIDTVKNVQGLSGASAGAVPQFGPPSASGVPQPQLLDLTQLMLQNRR